MQVSFYELMERHGGHKREPTPFQKAPQNFASKDQKKKVCERQLLGLLLYQDNAPAHTVLSVKQFLARKHITVLDHSIFA